MPQRGDFETEYDNEAEMIIADMEFKDEDTPWERGEQPLPLRALPVLLTGCGLRAIGSLRRAEAQGARDLQQQAGRARRAQEVHSGARPARQEGALLLCPRDLMLARRRSAVPPLCLLCCLV